MATKKKKDPGKSERVTLFLPPEVVQGLDQEVARIKAKSPGVNPTRSSVARAIVKGTLLRSGESDEDKMEAHRVILRDAASTKLRGKSLQNEGKAEEAQSLFLLAASMELEALSILGTKNEVSVRSTIIETLVLLKAATGYKKLPEVPHQEAAHKHPES